MFFVLEILGSRRGYIDFKYIFKRVGVGEEERLNVFWWFRGFIFKYMGFFFRSVSNNWGWGGVRWRLEGYLVDSNV